MISSMMSPRFILVAVMAVALFRADQPMLAAGLAALWVVAGSWLDYHALSADVTTFAISHNLEMQDLSPAIGFAYGDGPCDEEDEVASTVPMGFGYPHGTSYTLTGEVNR